MKAKKIIVSLTAFALMMVMTLSVAATSDTQTTTLEIDVESTYTLSIPKSQNIVFEVATTDIGEVKMEGNIRLDEEIIVDVTRTEFESLDDPADKIDYTLTLSGEETEFVGAVWSESSLYSGTATIYPLTVNITQQEWDNARAGNYKSVITFTAKIYKVTQ